MSNEAEPELRGYNRFPDRPMLVPDLAHQLQAGELPLPVAKMPIAQAQPRALPPISVSSLNDIRGIFFGWAQMTPLRLKERYGAREKYIAQLNELASSLVQNNRLFDADRKSAVAAFVAMLPGGYE